MQFLLIWTIGYILGGAPQIQKMPSHHGPLTLEECQSFSQDAHRIADWARGRLGQPLEFPLAVYGECEPVQRDASRRTD